MVLAGGWRSDIVCAHSCLITTDSSASNSFLWLSVLRGLHCLSCRRSSPRTAAWADSPSSSARRAGAGPNSSTQATGLESSDDEYGILEDERCIDTGVFQQRCFLHELVFACSQLPPQQPRISCTLLTQADWCAVRKVARCELGLHAVVDTVEKGACVIW